MLFSPYCTAGSLNIVSQCYIVKGKSNIVPGIKIPKHVAGKQYFDLLLQHFDLNTFSVMNFRTSISKLFVFANAKIALIVFIVNVPIGIVR